MTEFQRPEPPSAHTVSGAASPREGAKPTTLSRRELLKGALVAGALVPQGFPGREGRRRRQVVDPSQIPAYKYRTLPLTRFPALQAEYDRARGSARLSRNPAFLDQVAPLSFRTPPSFPGAKSVVVLAAFAKPMYVNFRLDGNTHRILVPPQYYTDELNAKTLKAVVQKEIVKTAGSRVEDVTEKVPLKLLAARSGLGYYGRNNLIFVEGMGSYNLLYAFLTDHQFADDGWSEIGVLDRCHRCDHCDRICPTGCITRSDFVIDIDKCLTLHNENPGAFPGWMPRGAHHALMGCLSCQSPCPVNGGIAELYGTLEEVSEEETRKILKGTPDDPLLKSLQRKLKQFPATQSKGRFPVLTRNLAVLVRPQV